MALKLSISESSVGVPFSTAYAKITNFYGSKDQLQYQVVVYASQNARQAEASPVANHAFYMATPVGDLMTAMYQDLKNQVGFESSEDC